MKTIYTCMNGRVYKLNQNTSIPGRICTKQVGSYTCLVKNQNSSTVEQQIYINTISDKALKSNKQLYDNMLDEIRRRKITEVNTIENRFKIYIDYSLYKDDNEIDHSVVIRPIEPVDEVLPLGVDSTSELVYRRVKSFKGNVEFKVHNSLPYGIMNNRAQNFKFVVNELAIFQDFTTYAEYHGSTYEVAYPYASQNFNNALENTIMVYSSKEAGINFQLIALNYAPRMVVINYDIILGTMIVAYNSDEVDYLVENNLRDKYRPYPDPKPPIHPHKPPHCPGKEDPDNPVCKGCKDNGYCCNHKPKPPVDPCPEEPDQPEIIPPVHENYPPADGWDGFNRKGVTGWYEKCRETTPHALKVVEDNIPEINYDKAVMIHRGMVVRDIPDVQIGDYVVFRKGYNIEYI